MSPTDEQIDAITNAQWGDAAKYLHAAYRAYARAIESAATAPLLKRISELERELEAAKTVPMKYRRMEFNAQLQQENESLRTQLEAVQGEPVAWVSDEMDIEFSHKPWMSAEWTPLYTHPQQASKPMTDADVKRLCVVGPVYAPNQIVERTPAEYRAEIEAARIAGVRIAERHHKIGEKQ
jgi:hypothetical protein